MDIEVKIENKQVEIDKIKFQKMVFLFNALDNGWSIKKEKILIFLQKIMKGKKKYLTKNI
jgi:hypothetical protein